MWPIVCRRDSCFGRELILALGEGRTYREIEHSLGRQCAANRIETICQQLRDR